MASIIDTCGHFTLTDKAARYLEEEGYITYCDGDHVALPVDFPIYHMNHYEVGDVFGRIQEAERIVAQ